MGKARQIKRSRAMRLKAKQDLKEQSLSGVGHNAIFCEEYPVERIWDQRAIRLMEGKYRGTQS